MPRLDLDEVEYSPLRRQVASQLRTAILNMTLMPGDRLIERELCEATGVSRTSLREALRELEVQGLVKTVPNKGLVVSSVSAQEAREIYDVRSQIEGLIGRRSANLRSNEDLEELRMNFAAIEHAVGKGDLEEYAQLKHHFYAILMRVTSNPILSEILVNLQSRVAQFRTEVMLDKGRVPVALSEQRAIIDAIAERDERRAEVACMEHVRNAGALVIRLIENQRE